MLGPVGTERYALMIEDDPLVQCKVDAVLGMPSVRFGSFESFCEGAVGLSPLAAFVDIHLQTEALGLVAIEIIRQRWSEVPIIVMTSDASDALLTDAFELGADDYLRKPLNVRELQARLQARLRERARSWAHASQAAGDIVIDIAHGTLTRDDLMASLSKVDLRILMALIDAKGNVVPRSELKRLGWGAVTVSEKALDRKVHIIRDALHSVSAVLKIRVAYGKGFRLECDDGFAC
jgi:DNA-binding response OmpR family regulator